MKITISVIASLLVLLCAGCQSPLSIAASRSDINAVKELLDKGADVNEKNALHGGTALKAASSAGRVEIVKLLLDRGADVNLESGNMGWTALSAAAWFGHHDVAMLLIERGADINIAVAGLRRGIGTGNAVEFLNKLDQERISSQLTAARLCPKKPSVPVAITSDAGAISPTITISNKNSADPF